MGVEIKTAGWKEQDRGAAPIVNRYNPSRLTCWLLGSSLSILIADITAMASGEHQSTRPTLPVAQICANVCLYKPVIRLALVKNL